MRAHGIRIRPATVADDQRLASVAAEGDSEADPRYLAFVRGEGTLLVAEATESTEADGQDGDPAIAGFGGTVPADEGTMITDLFVATAQRGRGVGGLLLDALVGGHERVMTCSSRHPAALAGYRSRGLEPRHRVLYLVGAAVGGGPPLSPAPWGHGRERLVDWYAAGGATVTHDLVVSLEVGDEGAMVHRLLAERAVDVMDELRRALPAGTGIRVRVPEVHPLANHLLRDGFTVEDYDTFCASTEVDVDPWLAAVDPGLW